jgi:CubicO group peptidase (beta-lactamase class C family)
VKHKKIFFDVLLVVVVIMIGFSLYRFMCSPRLPCLCTSMRFDRYVSDVMDTLHVPGLAIAVVHNNDIVCMKGYGVREIGTSDAVTTETIFPIGSCTKAFTAAALGLLVDEGKIDWDDTIHTFFPDFTLYDPYVTRELTISDMLSHRSGIEDSGLLYYRTHFSREELVHKLRYLKPAVGFRVSGVYSNLMYLTSGQIIPAVTGQSWDDFVTQRLLMPLGMKNSSTSITAFTNTMNLAKPHMIIDGEVRSIPFLNIDNAAPAGSINATIADMACWVKMLVNNGNYDGVQIIKPETVEYMHSPQSIMGKGHPYGLYGLGWGLSDYNGHKTISHKGSIDGMSSIVGLLPDKKLGIVVITNMHESDARSLIMNYIFDWYLGVHRADDWKKDVHDKEEKMVLSKAQEKQKNESKRVVGSIPSLGLDVYVGKYSNDLYGDVIITHDEGHLQCMFLAFKGVMQHWYDDVFMFDSSHDYPTIGDQFLLQFQIKNNQVNAVSIKISETTESVFKKIK